MRAVKLPDSSTPSRSHGGETRQGERDGVDTGRRFSMPYCPVPSVTVVRTFSISAGLAASTVTPGSTAPDASRTAPLITACADAMAGNNTANPNTAAIFEI